MNTQQQPPIIIDPGSFRAVVVCWAGLCVTLLTGEDAPAKTAGKNPPVIVRPGEVGPPVTARIEMSVCDALSEEPPELADGPEVPEAHIPWDVDTSDQVFDAVPRDNSLTLVRTILGNVVDLDRHEDALAASRQTGQPLLLRLVER